MFQLITLSRDQKAYVWNTKDGSKICELNGRNAPTTNHTDLAAVGKIAEVCVCVRLSLPSTPGPYTPVD